MAPSLPRTSSRRRPGPSTRHSNGGGDVLRDPARCLRSETLCVDRERSGCRGVHGSRPVPSAALAGALGAGMTLESGAIVPLAYGAIVAPNVIPAQAGTQYTAQQWWRRCLARSGEVPAIGDAVDRSRAQRMRGRAWVPACSLGMTLAFAAGVSADAAPQPWPRAGGCLGGAGGLVMQRDRGEPALCQRPPGGGVRHLESVEAHAAHQRDLVGEHVAHRAQLAGEAVLLAHEPRGREGAAIGELRELESDEGEAMKVAGYVVDPF